MLVLNLFFAVDIFKSRIDLVKALAEFFDFFGSVLLVEEPGKIAVMYRFHEQVQIFLRLLLKPDQFSYLEKEQWRQEYQQFGHVIHPNYGRQTQGYEQQENP